MWTFRHILHLIHKSPRSCIISNSISKLDNILLVSQKPQTMASVGFDLSKPPIAAQKVHKVVFGAVDGENRGENAFKDNRYRDDYWFWLRDDSREKEEVLDHLTKENAYTQERTKHLNPLKDKLYAEHISHLKETDEDPPYRHGKFFYYTRTVKGKSYKIHCRKKLLEAEALPGTNSKEEIILDENTIAEGHKQCNIDEVVLSEDHNYLAYSVDFKGSETYVVKILNLSSGEELTDHVGGTCGDIVWGTDHNSFYYLTEDAAKRPYKAWKHTVGTAQDQDICLFTEEDDKFSLGISKSKDTKWLFLTSKSKETAEVSYVNLLAGGNEVITVQNRVPGLKYSIQSFET